MTDYRARQAARDAAARALAATHPHLRPVWQSKGGPLTAAAHNVRAELRHCFPGVAFALRMYRLSGGDALDASWVDGPTFEQVDRILRRYLLAPLPLPWHAAFGGVHYTSTGRELSDRALRSAARTVWARHGLDGEFDPALFRGGKYYLRLAPVTGDDVQTLVYREAGHRTWCIGHPLPAAVAPEGVEA